MKCRAPGENGPYTKLVGAGRGGLAGYPSQIKFTKNLKLGYPHRGIQSPGDSVPEVVRIRIFVIELLALITPSVAGGTVEFLEAWRSFLQRTAMSKTLVATDSASAIGTRFAEQ